MVMALGADTFPQAGTLSRRVDAGGGTDRRGEGACESPRNYTQKA